MKLIDDPCKIYDCSNSIERPQPKIGSGPVENDIMKYLKENAKDYYFKFVDSAEIADVIITNDIFPSYVRNLNKPLVKRMCAPYWRNQDKYRNIPLNESAEIADVVIFISEYSKNFYTSQYSDNLKSSCVVKHWVDPKVFYDSKDNKDNFSLVACASDWSRKEKRLSSLIEFGKRMSNIQIILIGKVNEPLPDNFVEIGYLDTHEDISFILNTAHGFINLSYRDAATKTIPQAIACGLPILYTNSGGTSEMVNELGVIIDDPFPNSFENDVPELPIANVINSYYDFIIRFRDVKSKVQEFNNKLAFRKMLDGYFEAISNVL